VFQETEESRRMFGNLAMTAHVRSALRQDTRTAKMQITITPRDGEVTLSGLVDMGLEPKDAVDVVSKVPGVRRVVDKLRMAMPGARHHVEG